jgi:type II secretory pathway pseudopilin PulG
VRFTGSHVRPDRSGEEGDTLVEVLVTVVIISMAVVALLGGLLTSTNASVTHRNMTTLDAVLRSFAESVRADVETQSTNGSAGPQYALCATAANYKVVGAPYPRTGPVGSVVDVFSTGFNVSPGPIPGATFAGSPLPNSGPAVAVQGASSSGAISEFHIPAEPAGTYALTPFDSQNAAASEFTVTPWVGSISPVTPGQTGPGSVVTASVTGFGGEKTLSVEVGATTVDPSNVSGNTTDATGNASLTFRLPSAASGSQPVTISDGSNTASPVNLYVATDTAPSDPLPTTSDFSNYSLSAVITYWDGSGWSNNCTNGGDSNLQLLTLHLADSQKGNAGGDKFSVVLANFKVLTTTATVVTSSANPSVAGQTVIYTATVTSSNGGTPTGTIEFLDNGTPISGCTNGHPPTATCTVIYNSADINSVHRSITAIYSGNKTTFGGGSSLVLSQVVSKAPTGTSLTSSANPSVTGQPVTFKAKVSVNAPGSGTPTGTVTFAIKLAGGGTVNCSNGNVANLSNGQPTCLVPTALVASGSPYSVTATYSGDSNFLTSSGSQTQTVNKAGSTTTLGSSANPSVSGQTVAFTASVTANAPGSGTPTGTVTFTIKPAGGGTVNCTTTNSPSLSNGQATCVIPNALIASGSPYTVTATYNGDSNYNTSATSQIQTVNRAATSTTLGSSANPSNGGKSVRFTANVAVNAPGSGTPTGTVTFTIKSALGGTVNCTTTDSPTLSNGQATCVAPKSSLVAFGSPYTVTATYNGDNNYTGSSDSLTQKVS